MQHITKPNKDPELPVWQLNTSHIDSLAKLQKQLNDIRTRAQLFNQKYQAPNHLHNQDNLLCAIAEYEKILIDSHEIMIVAQLNYYQNLADTKAVQLYQNSAEHITEISQYLVFFEQAIARLPVTLVQQWEKELGVYTRWIQLKQKFLPHYLDTETEKILLSKNLVAEKSWVDLYDKLFSNLRIKYQGQTLNYEMARHYMTNPQRSVRQKVSKLLSQALEKQNLPVNEIMNAILLNKKIEDQHRNYRTPLTEQNMSNDIQDEDLDNLVGAVKKNYHIAHRYYKIKAKLLSLKKLKYYDLNAPVCQNQELQIPWHKAQEIVTEAYESFSPKFAQIARQFFENKWIDAQVRPNKAGGAFCCHGTPGTNPHILMSYQNRIRDVMTLAHELGHGVHFVLAEKQPYLLQHTPLVISETASVFGEMLTFQHLLHHNTDKNLHLYLLTSKIEDKISTVMRQIAFHVFELQLHTARRQNQLSYEDICQIWRNTQQESLGSTVDLPKEYDHYWTGIPHFIHLPFYVYAYAFGDCLVNNLYMNYQQQTNQTKDLFVDKYIQMLQAGDSKNYRELLKMFDLDPKNKDFWQNGINFIAGLVDKLEEII